jgi:[CysO sulfur-carrier protein]-S-L-cysteine hydrolase
MNPKEIYIPRKIANQLLHLAQISPEAEICGLVSSKQGKVSHCYPVKNVANQPEQRFLLDASEQIAAMAQMRALNEDLFAIYHSHPTAPAQPSTHDIALVTYPEALHLIISLNTKGVLDMRGFKIDQQTAIEIPLIMCD